MNHWSIYLSGLTAVSFFALAGWVLSLARNKITHIDGMWSLFIGLAAYTYSFFFFNLHDRNILVLLLVTVWAIRLSAYLIWRQQYYPEDRRHHAKRTMHTPHYWLTSLFFTFGQYAILAWIVSFSLFGSIQSEVALNTIDYVGAYLVIVGIVIASLADYQLSRFTRNPNNKQTTLQSGLWQYCRHPNYFGECCVWWGFYCIAYGAGAWWTLPSPILMTLLLVKITGIANIEKNIANRRPDYASYCQHTNAILPWKPKDH